MFHVNVVIVYSYVYFCIVKNELNAAECKCNPGGRLNVTEMNEDTLS